MPQKADCPQYWWRSRLPVFHLRQMPPTMGHEGSDFGEIEFDDVIIRNSDFVGVRADGARCMAEALSIGRVFIAGSCLGIADRAYELSADYAISRVTFDKPLAGVREPSATWPR
jgi:isovaleryl-CoA dehydrogenase